MSLTSTVELSIIIINWNTAKLLRQCLESLAASLAHGSTEIIVVDNGSTDGSAEIVTHEFPQVRLIRNQANVGFTRSNNQGIAASTGHYILLLNSDTVVKPDAPTGLVEFMNTHSDVGVVGPCLLRPDGEPQAFAFGSDPTMSYLIRRGVSSLLLKRSLHDWKTGQVQSVDWVSGACLMVRREAINQAGLLDENIFMYFEDNDWCLRIRKAGWKVYYDPQVEVVHLGGQSLKNNPEARHAYYHSLDYFYAKHYSPLAHLALRIGLLLYRWLVKY